MAHNTRITEYNPHPVDELDILRDTYQGLTEKEIEDNKLLLEQIERMPRSLSCSQKLLIQYVSPMRYILFGPLSCEYSHPNFMAYSARVSCTPMSAACAGMPK